MEQPPVHDIFEMREAAQPADGPRLADRVVERDTQARYSLDAYWSASRSERGGTCHHIGQTVAHHDPDFDVPGHCRRCKCFLFLPDDEWTRTRRNLGPRQAID